MQRRNGHHNEYVPSKTWSREQPLFGTEVCHQAGTLIGATLMQYGYDRSVTVSPGEDQVQARAELLPEEKVAGSDDPRAQARAVLEESERRVVAAEETRRESTQVD